METLSTLIDSYGLLLLFGLGFVEYGGFPIASVPFLITAGSLARMGGLPMPGLIVAAATGGLLADAIWYGLARRHGDRVVGVACSLSSRPNACVGGVEARVTRLGAPYILTSKFVPGVGNLIAAAAGLGAFPALRFLGLDALALLLWASVYAGAGWVFAEQVESVIRVVTSYTAWALLVAVLLVALGGTYRYFKTRRHAPMHPSG